MSFIEVKNLYFRYDKYNDNAKNVLSDVSFNVEKGDFIALIGRSGSGKSTLISHMNGILKADSGKILYDGENIYDPKYDLTKLRFRCGVVFQSPDYQLFSDTVIEDVSFGVIKKGYKKEEAYKKSLEVLKMLSIEHLKDETPFNLSGGEKRKVAFAGVFAMEPEVLILDEPDAGLDSLSKKHMYEFLKKLNKDKNITIIFITHNLDDVLEYANKVLLINDGQLLSSDTPYKTFSNMALLDRCGIKEPIIIDIINELKKHGINTDKCSYDEIVNNLYNNMK